MAESNIRLTFDCPVKWSSMTDAKGGRYCNSCKKVVKDFTKTPPDQIPDEEHACGRFNITQLHKPFNDRRDLLISYYQRLSKAGRAGKVLLLLVIVMMYVTGCRPHKLAGRYSVKMAKKDPIETVALGKDHIQKL